MELVILENGRPNGNPADVKPAKWDQIIQAMHRSATNIYSVLGRRYEEVSAVFSLTYYLHANNNAVTKSWLIMAHDI